MAMNGQRGETVGDKDCRVARPRRQRFAGLGSRKPAQIGSTQVFDAIARLTVDRGRRPSALLAFVDQSGDIERLMNSIARSSMSTAQSQQFTDWKSIAGAAEIDS